MLGEKMVGSFTCHGGRSCFNIYTLAPIEDFIYHVGVDLKLNGVDIYTNVNESVGHWKNNEMKPFGVSIGKALKLLVVGKDELYA